MSKRQETVPSARVSQAGGDADQEAESKLREFRKQCPNIDSEWRMAVTARPPTMRRTDYVKLRVLYQQFDVKRAPGLATLVRTARFLISGFRKRVSGRTKR